MSTYIINSEPEETAVPQDADEMLIHDNSAGATKKLGLDTLRAQQFSGVTAVTAATLAVTHLAHAGKTITLDRAAGITVTLPAATGTGAKFHFVNITTVTSNNHIIQVADATDVMTGSARIAQDGADTEVVFEAGASDDTITMNGSTKGGIKGDSIELIDIALNLWFVRGMLSGTGTEATPFSAAV